MKVFLTGSSGFVGRGILEKLAAAGHETVCLVRPGSEPKLRPDPAWQDRVRLHPGDLFDLASLERGMAGCDAVIHLVGIIREQPGRGITFSRIHLTGTEHVLAIAKKTGIGRFIQMSALGARPGATSPYHQTKYAAERLVQDSGIPYTIFRPSVIFGPGDEFVNMLAGLVRLPITPVIGSGSYQLQPVSRQTVADVFTEALVNPQAVNQIFEVGGPERLSYEQILDSIGKALGKQQVRKLFIPLRLMKPVITLMEGFSFFPITNTQLTMLLEGNVCEDAEKLYNTFATPKVMFQQGIAQYLR
jgi:NADH dehydrogenase